MPPLHRPCPVHITNASRARAKKKTETSVDDANTPRVIKKPALRQHDHQAHSSRRNSSRRRSHSHNNDTPRLHRRPRRHRSQIELSHISSISLPLPPFPIFPFPSLSPPKLLLLPCCHRSEVRKANRLLGGADAGGLASTGAAAAVRRAATQRACCRRPRSP